MRSPGSVCLVLLLSSGCSYFTLGKETTHGVIAELRATPDPVLDGLHADVARDPTIAGISEKIVQGMGRAILGDKAAASGDGLAAALKDFDLLGMIRTAGFAFGSSAGKGMTDMDPWSKSGAVFGEQAGRGIAAPDTWRGAGASFGGQAGAGLADSTKWDAAGKAFGGGFSTGLADGIESKVTPAIERLGDRMVQRVVAQAPQLAETVATATLAGARRSIEADPQAARTIDMVIAAVGGGALLLLVMLGAVAWWLRKNYLQARASLVVMAKQINEHSARPEGAQLKSQIRDAAQRADVEDWLHRFLKGGNL